MRIEYKEVHDFKKEDLKELFLSVQWASGLYPERLAAAMKNFETVYSAWDKDRLVGLVCALDDGVMTAYIQFLLVHPEYRHRGIGKALLERVKEKYKDYLRISVIIYTDKAEFYEENGFKIPRGTCPVILSRFSRAEDT